MSEVRKKFVEGYYDQVLIGFNEFKSVIAQNRMVETVLPIQATDVSGGPSGANSGTGVSVETDYSYEPDAEPILNELLPIYVNMQFRRAVLASNAVEQDARTAATYIAAENAIA